MDTFLEIKDRDAWSTIRGFVYQVDTTILQWLELKENEAMELEKGEDIDIITHDIENNELSRTLEQIKHRENNLTLNEETTLDILLNYYRNISNNPGLKIKFKFITNTKYGIERPSLFVDGKSGIETWEDLRKSTFDKKDIRFIKLKAHLTGKLREQIIKIESDKSKAIQAKNLKDFLSYIKKDHNLANVISDFEWSFKNFNHTDISAQIKERIKSLVVLKEPHDAGLLYSRLFLFVFKLLCKKDLKRLVRKDLLEQVELPTLSHYDEKLLSIVNNFLHLTNEKINNIEKEIEFHSSQLAHLADKIHKTSSVDTNFEFTIQNLSIQSPATIKNGSIREKKVAFVCKLLNNYCWVNFQGIKGTGKTQLAALVCEKFENYWWLDLRPHNQDLEKTTILVEIFFSKIFDSTIASNRAWWVENIAAKTSKTTLIILNDVPQLDANSRLALLLALLTNQNSHVKILTTSNYKAPIDLISTLKFDNYIEYYDFEFSDEEIIECLLNNGADDTISDYINLISLITHRNPRLVTAVIHYLKSINWGHGSEDILEVILTREFSLELLQDCQKSIKNFIKNEQTRELLYRLSLIHWEIKYKEIKAISEVKERINFTNEKLQDLLDIWIQQQGGSYQISPLIIDIGMANLPQETIHSVHVNIAQTILSEDKVDPLSASRAIISFLKGKSFDQAGFLLLNVFKAAKTFEEITYLENWGYLNYWSETDIPKSMNLMIRAFIRAEQIRLNKTIGKDTKIYHEKLELYSRAEHLDSSEKLLIHFLCLLDYKYGSINQYCGHLRYISENWRLIQTNSEMEIDASVFSRMIWMPIQKIETSEEVLLWLQTLKLLETTLGIDTLDNEMADPGLTIICNNLTAYNAEESNKNWHSIALCLETLIEFFKMRQNELLATIVRKYQIRMKFIVYGDHATAENTTEKHFNEAKLKESKYILSENIAKLFFNDQQIAKSRLWLLRAIETHCILQTEYVETLIYAAITAPQGSAAEAVLYCEKATELFNSTENDSVFLELEILGELAIAYWLNNDNFSSLQTFEVLVDKLFKLKESNFNNKWIKCFMLCGHSLGYISAEVGQDPIPEKTIYGSDYVRPYQGIFFLSTNDLSEIYHEKNDPIIFVHLALFSAGLNEIPRAYSWAIKAFDLSRQNGNQKVFLMIAAACSEYAIVNYKFIEAFESYLLFAASSAHLKGPAKQKLSALDHLMLSEILSQKPSKEWNISEDLTISIALIPIFILVLIAHMEENSEKQKYLNSYKETIIGYIPDASNRELLEKFFNISLQIIEKTILEYDLITMANKYEQQEHKNLRILCAIGIIYLSKDYLTQLGQIINIFPYLAEVHRPQKSVYKYVLAPFIKTKCLEILKNEYVGQRINYDKISDIISTVGLEDKNALQKMILQVVNALDFHVPDIRKAWLYL